MTHVHPPWLQNVGPAPKLYAWTPSNLSLSSPSPSSSPDLDKRIYLLGVGNIGRLFACHLARHTPQPPITLVVHRQDLLRQWAASPGITLTRGDKTTVTKDVDIEYWTDEPPSHGPVREVADGQKLRHLFVSTKTTAAMPMLDKVRRYLDARSTVAFAQNGMCKLWPPHGTAYTARYADGAPSFLACVVNHGVLSNGAFHSLHAAPADASIGPVLLSDKHDGYLLNMVATAPGLDARAVSSGELWVLQLEKLVMNAVINPLTALIRCRTGVLFEEDRGILADVMHTLLVEISAVLQALIRDDSSADVVASYAAASGDAVDSVKDKLCAKFDVPPLEAYLWTYGKKVGANRSSMLQDADAGKPTEVRDFNGWIVDMARFLGALDVSANEAVVDLIESKAILTQQELGTRLL